MAKIWRGANLFLLIFLFFYHSLYLKARKNERMDKNPFTYTPEKLGE